MRVLPETQCQHALDIGLAVMSLALKILGQIVKNGPYLPGLGGILYLRDGLTQALLRIVLLAARRCQGQQYENCEPTHTWFMPQNSHAITLYVTAF